MEHLRQRFESSGVMDSLFDDSFSSTMSHPFSVEIGDVRQCFIAHVTNIVEKICYLVDTKKLPDANLLYEKDMRKLKRIPSIGEMFVYNCKNKFLMRAIRTAEKTEFATEYYAKIIDIGSTILIDSTSDEHFEICEKAKRLPPFAIACKVFEIRTEQHLDLLNLLHKRMYYKVLDMRNDCLYVNLFDRDLNPFRSYKEFDGDAEFFNCFKCPDFRITTDDEPSVIVQRNRVQFFQNEDLKDCSYINWNFSFLEESEHTDLHCEPSGGQIPSSPTRAIKNPANNWDTKTYIYDSLAQFLPIKGKHYTAMVTHVINVDEFYAQIADVFQEKNTTLSELENLMNQQTKTYEEYYTLPAIGEFIVAKYHDNKFYRAKVVSRYDNENLKVFYIDFGNCANVVITDIYKWDESCNCLPAQAFHCRLPDIKSIIKPIDFEAIERVKLLVLNKYMTLKTVDIIEGQIPILIVRLKNQLNEDLSDQLCQQNHAIRK